MTPFRDPERRRAYQRDYQRRYAAARPARGQPGQHSRPRTTRWSASSDELDDPANARRCLHHWFTTRPCRGRAVWVNPRTGSRWCARHGAERIALGERLAPLDLGEPGPDDGPHDDEPT